MRIVVFGAGGFVGGGICEQLAQREDVELVACLRKWASAVRVARRGIDVRRADLEDGGDLSTVLSGADVVINATMPAPSRESELVHALYEAATAAHVRRFVQFSSAAVYGDRRGDVDEVQGPAPIDDYSRGKAKMEHRLVSAAAGRGRPQLFILRPSIIYGPFSDAWTVRYVQRIVSGRWRALGRNGQGTCNLVHAHDVAAAAVAAATGETEAGVHVLNLNGPDRVTWNEYIERLGDALGICDRVTPNATFFRARIFSAEAMRTAAQFGPLRAFYKRSAGTTRVAMKGAQDFTKLYPSAGELKLLRRRVHYRSDKATRVLRFVPSVSLDAGLQQSVAWCRTHGIV